MQFCSSSAARRCYATPAPLVRQRPCRGTRRRSAKEINSWEARSRPLASNSCFYFPSGQEPCVKSGRPESRVVACVGGLFMSTSPSSGRATPASVRRDRPAARPPRLRILGYAGTFGSAAGKRFLYIDRSSTHGQLEGIEGGAPIHRIGPRGRDGCLRPNNLRQPPNRGGRVLRGSTKR